MVAQLLRLRLDLLRGGFRRDRVQVAGMVVVGLAGLAGAIAAAVGIAGLRSTTPDIARATIVVVGSLVVLGFVLIPFAFGGDDMLDPRRFALLGLPTARLATGLAAAAFLSVPAAMAAILAVAQVVTWARAPVPLLLAILSAVIVVPTCVLAARVSSGIAASLLSARRARDVAGIAVWFVLALLAPLSAVLATLDWESQMLPVLRRLTAVLAWTPLGAVWAVPGDAAAGDLGTALARLAIAVGTLVALAAAWRAIVERMINRYDREVAARRYSGLGWFEHVAATPRAAIAARSMSYWWRDRRYRVALAAVPVAPTVGVAALLVAGVPATAIAWLPVPLMCLFLGWLVHNDLAHDSTAFWLHVSSGTRGTDDRWGRLAPPLSIGLVLVIVGSIATVIVVGDWRMLPGLIGLSACVLLAGLGVSSVTSAAFPYPAVHPGDSPFAQPQAVGRAAPVVQACALLATILVAAPVVLFVVLGTIVSPRWFVVALVAGLVIGVLALLVGVRIGARILTRRAPELLAFTLQN